MIDHETMIVIGIGIMTGIEIEISKGTENPGLNPQGSPRRGRGQNLLAMSYSSEKENLQ